MEKSSFALHRFTRKNHLLQQSREVPEHSNVAEKSTFSALIIHAVIRNGCLGFAKMISTETSCCSCNMKILQTKLLFLRLEQPHSRKQVWRLGGMAPPEFLTVPLSLPSQLPPEVSKRKQMKNWIDRFLPSFWKQKQSQ